MIRARSRISVRGRDATVALACAAFVTAMVAMAFAAVPLYQLFCQVTGFGGTTQRALAAPGKVLDRTIEVRLDANIASGLPWRFRAVEHAVSVRLGETATVRYEVENLSSKTTTGTATFNVSPPNAGAFFNKIECFCFTEQSLKPGERAELPVLFFIDPALAEDADARGTHSIVLSYTFFAAPERNRPVAASGEAAPRL